MESMHYLGPDVHKKTISCCVKKVNGSVVSEKISATIFSGCIYDLRLQEASEGESCAPVDAACDTTAKKNDRVDGGRIWNLLRCDLLPESRMASTGHAISVVCCGTGIWWSESARRAEERSRDSLPQLPVSAVQPSLR